jgi:hypothetical protein
MLSVLALFAVLFPSPLHLTRVVTDPVAGSKSVIEEYCHGDRIVSIAGRRTAIAEYDRKTLTTIDFEAGTYSVVTFDELAKAWRTAKPAAPKMRVTPHAGHTISREAAEVLLGVAWPAPPLSSEAVGSLRAPRVGTNAAGTPAEYSLPLEQVIELGEGLELRNSVIRVGSELAPAEAMAIPPGARRVESRDLALQRFAEELDGKQ